MSYCGTSFVTPEVYSAAMFETSLQISQSISSTWAIQSLLKMKVAAFLVMLFALSKADVPDPELPPSMLWTLGMNYTLECVLSNLKSLADYHVTYTLEIRGPGTTLRMSQTASSPNITYTFSPVLLSDAGNYSCNGTFFIMEDSSTHSMGTTVTTIAVDIPYAPVPEISPPVGVIYAGSRLLLNCTCTAVTLPNQTMVDILWYKDNQLLLNSSNFSIGPTTPLTSTSYFKNVLLSPVTSQDSGVYWCNATFRPMAPSTFVHSRVQSTSYKLLVTVPTVGVSLESTSSRALTVPPYNMMHLMCSATVVAAVTYPFAFSWTLVVNGSIRVAVAEGVNTTDSTPPVGLSSLQVTLATPGVYVYSCFANISEASALGSGQTTITVGGPSLPFSPTNLQVTEVNASAVSVMWRVGKVAFTPEVYKVWFWTSPDVAYITSTEVNGTSDLSIEDMDYTVLVSGLTPNLHYTFQVEASNTIGSTRSKTFMRTSIRRVPFAIFLIYTIAPALLAVVILTIIIVIARCRCARNQEAATLRNDIDMKNNEVYICQQFKMTENESYANVVFKGNS